MDDELQASNTISPKPSESLVEKFSELFPGLLRDGALDVEALADLLEVDVAGIKGGKEKFGLSWAGKKLALEALQTPSLATLAPDISNSIDFHSAQNVFIEGDNLEVLKLLQNAYNDQIRLIYIDPPYNTGNDFVYNDDFSDPIKHYMEVTGQADAEGNRLIANTETNGRKHSNWLTMMYPRLSLARNLLTQDGAIFVSIDDNEVHHLRLLMDEIFGPENFIGQFIWAAGRKNDAKYVSASHEYIVCYSRNQSSLQEKVGQWRQKKTGLDEIYKQVGKVNKEFGLDHSASTKAMKSWFKNLSESEPAKRHKQYSHVDARGLYFPGDIAWPGGGGPKYEVLHPLTKQPVKIPSGGWRFTESRMQELIAENRIHFGADEAIVPCIKRYLEESEYEVPYSVFYQDGRGSTKRLSEFLGGPYFDFPKDELVLQQIIEFATDKDSIILDFFAGSGTTGHSVALQNEKDGGNRKYVLVTIDEPTSKDSFARKKGIEKVSDITLMRLKKVAETITNAKDAGLKVLKLQDSAFVRQSFILDDSNMLLADSTTKADQPHEKIAAEITLSTGKRLDEKWQDVKLGTASGIRVGKSFVVLEPGFDISIIDAAQVAGISEIYFLEDHFAGRDPIKSNLYFESKKQSITIKTF